MFVFGQISVYSFLGVRMVRETVIMIIKSRKIQTNANERVDKVQLTFYN